ncbi:alpha/beta hydrolase [Streptomyces sp. NPDC026092]|uniref:alpha/beta hydrolase n=1 Tax=Streptomyces sp. NPDC026092 TaxID=3154797 RepID=UPI0033CBAC68
MDVAVLRAVGQLVEDAAADVAGADQGGHGIYPFSGNTCAKITVTAFLTTGHRPAKDLACAAEPTE